MPAHWDPPLPPVPSSLNPNDVAAFMLNHSPREVSDLIEGICVDVDFADGPVAAFTEGIRHLAAENPDHAFAITERLAHSDNSFVRVQVPRVFRSLLCRGIDRMEEIAWDEMLQDPDDTVFWMTQNTLYDIVSSSYSRDNIPGFSDFTWTDETYDEMFGGKRWPERLTHYLKLGRVLARREAIDAEREEALSRDRAARAQAD